MSFRRCRSQRISRFGLTVNRRQGWERLHPAQIIDMKVLKKNTHPLVSLTDFVDFVAKSGRPKLTVVKQIKRRTEYDPKEDFWRRLREAIVEFHRTGQTDKNRLDGVLNGLTHKPKVTAYPTVLSAYKRFLGRKDISWFLPAREAWTSGGLTVNVNPELGLEINGERHLIKLYFKRDKMAKAKADLILLLMKEALKKQPKGTKFALLDVRENKLFAAASPPSDLRPLLEGEAVNFTTIWNALPDLSSGGNAANAA